MDWIVWCLFMEKTQTIALNKILPTKAAPGWLRGSCMSVWRGELLLSRARHKAGCRAGTDRTWLRWVMWIETRGLYTDSKILFRTFGKANKTKLRLGLSAIRGHNNVDPDEKGTSPHFVMLVLLKTRRNPCAQCIYSIVRTDHNWP